MKGTQTTAPHGAYANASVIEVHPVASNATSVIREAVARLGDGATLRFAKGERIGFASNWRREPSELVVTNADGRRETVRLAPLETIVLTPGENTWP